jgi:hypothetical protein
LIAKRYLCSQLVLLCCGAVRHIVNLEEIWETGAVLEAEEPFILGSPAEIRCGTVHLFGTITRVQEHSIGWRIEMDFSPLTPWSPERFEPEHLLDLSEMG